MTELLYFKITGFLSMLSQGLVPSNVANQAEELLNEIGDAMAAEYPERFKAENVTDSK